MSSKTKEKSTQTTALDPQYSALVYGAADRAKGLADSYSSYAGPRVAGFNPLQTEAQTGLMDFARSGAGSSMLRQAGEAAGGAAGYQPMTVAPQMLSEADLSAYMNPYTQQVVDTSLADMNREREIALTGARRQATAAQAWGGSGAALLQSQLSDNYDRAAATTAANLRSQGYAQALDSARFDIGSGLTAQQANQAAGLQGAGLRLNAAGVLGDLSNQDRAQQMQDWGILSSVGDARQGQQQKEHDAALQAYLEDQQQRMALAQLYNQSVGLTPQTGTTTGTRTVTSSPGLTDLLSAGAGLMSGGGALMSGLGALRKKV